MSPNKLRPAVFGGLLIGVLSALPIVNVGNVCCCLWVICGGVLAAHLMQQEYPYAITIGDGAVVGLLAGLVGGILTVVISVPVDMAVAPFQARFLDRFLQDAGDLPFDVRDFVERFRGPLNPIVIGIRLIFTSIVFTVFGLLGGLLGAAIFKKGTPPGTAEVLPPQP